MRDTKLKLSTISQVLALFMNTLRSKLNLALVILPIIWHLWLVFGDNFFLSPEITLYPYLTTKGLIPYQQLIDQHFPLLFFGPLNLAQFGVTSPSSALYLFIVLILLTDFGFILAVKDK